MKGKTARSKDRVAFFLVGFFCIPVEKYKKVNLTSSHYVFERIYGQERLRIVCNFESQTPYEEVNGEILLNKYETFDGVLQPFQVLVFKE